MHLDWTLMNYQKWSPPKKVPVLRGYIKISPFQKKVYQNPLKYTFFCTTGWSRLFCCRFAWCLVLPSGGEPSFPDALDVIISYQILTSYSDTLLIRTCTIYANLDHMNHSFLLLLWSLNLVCILHTPARPKASTIRDVGSLMETTSKGHEWPRL